MCIKKQEEREQEEPTLKWTSKRVNLGRKKEQENRKGDACAKQKKKLMLTSKMSIRDHEFIKINFYMDVEVAPSLPVGRLNYVTDLKSKKKRKKQRKLKRKETLTEKPSLHPLHI